MSRRVAFIIAALLGLASRSVAAEPPITVSDAWSRPATGAGVVYATIANSATTPDRLVGATTPSAAAVELHESMRGSGSMNGVESMQPITAIAVPAQGSVTLAPGGYHLMLTGLKKDLQANDAFLVRMHFANAGWIVTIVRVRPI